MTTLLAPNGKSYETKDVPGELDPFFCSKCGSRMGWVAWEDSSSMTYCEDCIADMQQS